jgi:hypothetical protein
MARWFRLYADAMRNPKVLRLADKDFRLWVRLLAVASENDGIIPPVGDLRMVLAMRLDHVEGGLSRLMNTGLIDALDDCYQPHHWDKFQYKSDTSTERVRRHREKGNVSETLGETPPEADTETDVPLAKANGDDPDKVFWDSAKGYLGRSKGGLIGKLAGQYGREEVASAITIAMLQRPQPPDRCSYVAGVLKQRAEREARPLVPL